MPHPHSLIAASKTPTIHLHNWPATKSLCHWSGGQFNQSNHAPLPTGNKSSATATTIIISSPPAHPPTDTHRHRLPRSFSPPLKPPSILSLNPVTRSPFAYRHHASTTRNPAQHNLSGRLCSVAAERPEHAHYSWCSTRLSCRCYLWRVRLLWKTKVRWTVRWRSGLQWVQWIRGWI